ncbi:CoA pyrophosphatase [Ramlibacter sp.]|uniref:CoA pyrophosphatase n=1 Tax=Ramlibacter sp. TaxID=1917967 RepID=UPI0026234646|nr:CoA pyrophosphatase [Ramlibacter sp.]
MPIDPSAAIPPDTPLSKIPNFDPREAPVVAVDTQLPAVAAARLTPDALRRRFAQPPAWEPELRSEKRFSQREPAAAAVLVPIVLRERPTVLLTQRTVHLTTHQGQVAFPGGKRDDTDVDAADTALREAHEEIGLERPLAEVIGTLPTYTTGTMFIITPVIALVQPDYQLALNAYEVDDAFEVPLDFLMDPANHRLHAIELSGVRRQWFSMPYADNGKDRFIWGATAAMLRNLYRFLAA